MQKVIFLSALFLVLLFSRASAQAPDAAVPATALVAESIDRNAAEHAALDAKITALLAENATLKAKVAAPKPVGTQGVMASLPSLFGLLAVFVRRLKPPASMVHKGWFIPVASATAAVLSALSETAVVGGGLTWNTALAAATGGLATWAGASYTSPKAAPPTLVQPPSGGST